MLILCDNTTFMVLVDDAADGGSIVMWLICRLNILKLALSVYVTRVIRIVHCTYVQSTSTANPDTTRCLKTPLSKRWHVC